MKTLDSNYKQFWMWSNKIKNAEERKIIRDQAFEKYQQQLQKVKKMREQKSDIPSKVAELKIEEENCRSMGMHLESSSKNLT